MTQRSTRDEIFRQVVVRAVTSPVSLFLGVSGALMVSSPVTWPLGLAALAAEAGWVWSRIRSEDGARAISEELQQARWQELIDRLEAISGSLEPETSRMLNRIVEAQERLLGMYAAAPAGLPHSRVELTSLLQHCLSLAEKRHQLQGYLTSVRGQELQRQAIQLQAKLESAHDSVTRGLYEQALEQKRQELENYVRLEEAVGRIDGQLTAVQCTFDNLMGKVVRMRSGDLAAPAPVDDPVFAELDHLTRGVAALEASLTETLALRGAA